MRDAVRKHWRATPQGEGFAINFLDRMRLSGMLIKPGAGLPPVWVVTTRDGLFLATLAGAASDTKDNINNRFGDLNNADTPVNQTRVAGPPSAAEAAVAAAARAVAGGAGDYLDAARDPEVAEGFADAEKPRWDDEYNESGGHEGFGADDAEADVGGGDRIEEAHCYLDRLLPKSHHVGEAAGDLGRSLAEVARLRNHRIRAEENAVLAARASERPRETIDRELTEIEERACSIVSAASNKPTWTPEMRVAKKVVDEAMADVAKAESRLKKIDAMLPSDKNKPLSERELNIYGKWFEQDILLTHKRKALTLAKVELQRSQSAACLVEDERQATAKVFAQQIELVGKVRTMLAAAPILAKYGTLTLLAYALEPRSPDFRNLKDIWGIPYTPPPPRPSGYKI